MPAELSVAPAAKSITKSSTDIFKVSSFSEAFEVAKVLAESGMVPKQYMGKPAAIMATWQHSLELGVGLMQGLQGISNINGTPAVFGDLGWAIVTNHPDFEDADEDLQADSATCTLKRRGRTAVTRTYTINMAKEAMLMGKDNWKHHTRRMLQWRARSWAMRDLFPDALKGLAIAEEAQDFDSSADTPPPQPKPQGRIEVPTIDAKTTLAEVVLPKKDVQTEEVAATSVQDIAPDDDPEVKKQLEAEAKQWATGYYAAYKEAGKTPEESKAFLKKNFNIEDSRQVSSDKREFAMAQAKQGFPCMKATENPDADPA